MRERLDRDSRPAGVPGCDGSRRCWHAQIEWGTYVLADPGFRQELEELELAEGAQAEHGVVEGRDLLDGDLAAGGPVDGGTDDAVRALADDIEHLILCACSRTQCEER